MQKRLAIAVALLLTGFACVDRPSSPTSVQPAQPIDLTGTPEEVWRQHVAKEVTVHGRFSLQGKIGPMVVIGGKEIYIKPKSARSWVEQFGKFEDREVSVTGILRYWQSPDVPQGPVTEARIPSHFYFEEETVNIHPQLGNTNN